MKIIILGAGQVGGTLAENLVGGLQGTLGNVQGAARFDGFGHAHQLGRFNI